MQSQRIRGTNMTQLFDTLKFTKRAIKAGLTQQQAEFHAEELATVINDSLVTKDYLDAKLKEQLSSFENRLIWKLIGIIGFMLSISQTVGHFFK